MREAKHFKLTYLVEWAATEVEAVIPLALEICPEVLDTPVVTRFTLIIMAYNQQERLVITLIHPHLVDMETNYIQIIVIPLEKVVEVQEATEHRVVHGMQVQ